MKILALSIYFCSGLMAITGLSEALIIKESLDLSASFLISVGFWAGIPWTVKIVIGKCVDSWGKKVNYFIVLGSILQALGILSVPLTLETHNPAIYSAGAVLLSTGLMIHDVIADKFSVIAGKDNHHKMQTQGRTAAISGALLASLFNFIWYQYSDDRMFVFLFSPIIPLIPCLFLRKNLCIEKGSLNLRLILGSFGYLAIALAGYSLSFLYVKEVFSILSLIGLLVLVKLCLGGFTRELIASGIVLFIFRATPSMGPGASWFQIDVLGFTDDFLAGLDLAGLAACVTGLFLFRNKFSGWSIQKMVVFLTFVNSFLFLPFFGVTLGVHTYLSSITGGLVDARFVAVSDALLSGPFSQLAMIPMLAWIASTCPKGQQATYFAIAASLMNLASQFKVIFSGWVNSSYPIERGIYDNVSTQASIVLIAGLALPLLACLIFSGRWVDRPKQTC